jgi:hypothetical protein
MKVKGNFVLQPCCLVCFILMIGCNNQTSETNSPPEFSSDPGWVVENIDPSYWTKWGYSKSQTAFWDFWIHVEDPDGIADISLITVTSPQGGYWVLQDSGNGVSAYNSQGQFWGGWVEYYSSSSPHGVALGKYTVIARDSASHQITDSIFITSPGGGGSSGFLYSETYTGSTQGGTPMIRRAVGITATSGSSDLWIYFSTADSRVNNGFVLLYNASAEYITSTVWFKNKINTGLGIYTDDSVNALHVLSSELTLGSHSFNEIQGLHVVLTDGKQYAPHENWYDHLSISAYIPVQTLPAAP